MATQHAPLIRIQPVVQGRSRDQAAEAQQLAQLKAAWAEWDAAVAGVPRARVVLEQAPALLEEVEAQLAKADEAIAQARDAYHRREVIGPGGAVLADAVGRALIMTYEAQENADPEIVRAKSERSRWVVARRRLWDHMADARETISVATGRRPNGERPGA